MSTTCIVPERLRALPPRPPLPVDAALVELIDAMVEAVDINRTAEIDRLRSALEPFGGNDLFITELRLSGTPTSYEGCICGGIL